MAWYMFVLACLSLAIAFYIRFREGLNEPFKPLLHGGVGALCFGLFWLWVVVDGIPEKYPDPLLRVMTSTFSSVAGGFVSPRTLLSAGTSASLSHLSGRPAARQACTTDTTCAWLHVSGATESCWPS